MSNIRDNLDLIKNQIKKEVRGKGYYVKDSIWNWDVLMALICIVILFPYWIREVKYVKVKNNKYKKEEQL